MSTLPGDSTIAGASTAPHAGRTATERYHRPRRAFGDAVLHAPHTLRALVRADEIWLVVLSAFVGCGAGVAVWLMTETTQLIHQLLFRISAGERLSAGDQGQLRQGNHQSDAAAFGHFKGMTGQAEAGNVRGGMCSRFQHGVPADVVEQKRPLFTVNVLSLPDQTNPMKACRLTLTLSSVPSGV